MPDLSPSEHKRILNSLIIPVRASGASRCDQPTAVLLAGQPGAGKSGLANATIDVIDFKKNHVRIDIDELREAHPKYGEIRQKDPKQAAAQVQKDASQWGKELRTHCIENRYNIVVDGTLGNPKNADKLIDQLKENGYQVEVHVMAIDKDRSDQGIYARYEKGLENGKARWVDPDAVAQKAYIGMGSSIATIEKNHPDVSVTYYGAGINEQGQRNTVQLTKPDGMSGQKLLENERDRDWSQVEKKNYIESSNSVIDKMQRRSAANDELVVAQAKLKGERYQSCVKDTLKSKQVDSNKSLEEQVKEQHKNARVHQARSGTYSGRITHITENEVVQQVKTRDFYVHGIKKGDHGMKVNNEVTITNRQGKTTIKNHSLDKTQDKKHGLTNTSKSPSEKSRGL